LTFLKMVREPEGKEKIADFLNELLDLRGGGLMTGHAPPIPAAKRTYLMLMSCASISSVVEMILELAW